MSQQDNNSIFGDDINSTPISKLQQIPMMTSKSDAGMAPIEPPMYNPTVETQQQKRVTFAEDDDVYDDKRAKKERRHHRKKSHYQEQQQQWAPPQYYPQLQLPQQIQPPPPAPPIQEKKTKKVLELLQVYGHRIVVFVLFIAILWYYRKLASFPYIGTGDGYINVVGSVGISLAASGIYGIIESLLD